jgi:hypothetical protein
MTLLLAMLQGPAPVPAAQPPLAQADSGSRIRITVSEPSKFRRVGRLVSWDADSLRFTSADTSGQEAVAIESLSRLERSLGRRSNAGRGAMIGALVGSGAGLILGIAASADEGSWFEVGPEEIALVTAFMGATGAGLGALAGAATKRERWEPVTLPARIARRPLRPRSIAGARVTIGF